METGYLLIDKPAGITSHDVVDRLRKITGEKRIGHAGTLDPFATGLLIVAVGREATKNIASFVGLDKTYEAQFVLGATTETLDTESEIITPPYQGGARGGQSKQDQVTPLNPPLLRGEIESSMQTFVGDIDQVPPMYSALKKQGKKLYELAREGKTVELEPRRVTIHDFRLLAPPKVEDGLTILAVSISCSSGTYIRALARDLGEKLGTSGYVKSLRRTSIGSFSLENAQQLADLSQDNWTEHLMHVNLQA